MATAIALAISAVPYRARNISPEDRVVWRRDILLCSMFLFSGDAVYFPQNKNSTGLNGEHEECAAT